VRDEEEMEGKLQFYSRPNIEWYTKVAAAIQNAIQCYCVIYHEKKRPTTQTLLVYFFKKVDRIEFSKEPELVPSSLGRE